MMTPELIGGRYRVRGPVGQGGMGTVWLCEDEVLRRHVAVKRVGLLPGESVTDSARAFREARTSAAPSHRNVVTVFDVVEDAGTIYLVMEFVKSRSLAELVREEGPLPPGAVARIGAQIAEGLAAAHAVDITHRDVKPGNVLVSEDGTAKITDFGIARNATETTLTESGFVTGTPTYFSPELARGAQPGPSADVWALGATLYAAVEGRSLYERRPNPVATLHDIATTLPPRPTKAGSLEQPLMRMLDRNPESRWSMAAAAQGLRHVADQLADDGTREYTREHTRGRRGRYVLLATVLLILVGGIAFAATLADGSPGPSRKAAGSRGGGPQVPSPTATAPTRSTPPAGRTSDAPSQPATARRPGKIRFLRRYYSTVPQDLDAGWAMLGPHEKSVGRGSYNKFWSSMTAVDQSRISTSPGSTTANITLTYHYKDGRVVDERQHLTLTRAADGRWLIDDDQVLSSTTR
jgi:serine/threonine protein kinase